MGHAPRAPRFFRGRVIAVWTEPMRGSGEAVSAETMEMLAT
jgi:hypothetical protein